MKRASTAALSGRILQVVPASYLVQTEPRRNGRSFGSYLVLVEAKGVNYDLLYLFKFHFDPPLDLNAPFIRGFQNRIS